LCCGRTNDAELGGSNGDGRRAKEATARMIDVFGHFGRIHLESSMFRWVVTRGGKTARTTAQHRATWFPQEATAGVHGYPNISEYRTRLVASRLHDRSRTLPQTPAQVLSPELNLLDASGDTSTEGFKSTEWVLIAPHAYAKP
jgi:hypothetical protein